MFYQISGGVSSTDINFIYTFPQLQENDEFLITLRIENEYFVTQSFSKIKVLPLTLTLTEIFKEIESNPINSIFEFLSYCSSLKSLTQNYINAFEDSKVEKLKVVSTLTSIDKNSCN